MATLASEQLKRDRSVWWLALLTIATSIGWFLLDGHLKISFADEGWLWYGTEALRRGEVPMRDFSSYDPGRYVWTAAWSYIFGHRLVALRLACVFFQCGGVFAGLLVARRLSTNWVFLISVALLLCGWMHPRFKLFEQSIALMAAYAGVLLLEKPTLRRHWWVGVFGGLSAFVGRNHGAYHLLAFCLLIAWGSWGESWATWFRRSLIWAAGLFVGYLPQLLMFALIRGYFSAFAGMITAMIGSGKTNIPAPVPWPWLIRPELPLVLRVSGIVEGCWYILLPSLLVAVLLRAVGIGRRELLKYPAFVATALVSLPYTHFVFSRPDIVHLSHGAPTAALTAIALAFTFGRFAKPLGFTTAALLLGATLWANLFQFGISLPLFTPPDALYQVDVRGDEMIVGRAQAQVLESARHLADDLAKPDEPILFMPVFPTLYPFTGRRSPTHEIYFVTPPDDRKLLEEIKASGVKWVLLQDYALDGHEELRFRNSNPLVMKYFHDQFEPVKIETLPRGVYVLHFRGDTPGS